MALTLRLCHARVLGDLAKLSPFGRIRVAQALLVEVDEAAAALNEVVVDAVREARRAGTSWAEIGEGTGISPAGLHRMHRGANPG